MFSSYQNKRHFRRQNQESAGVHDNGVNMRAQNIKRMMTTLKNKGMHQSRESLVFPERVALMEAALIQMPNSLKIDPDTEE